MKPTLEMIKADELRQGDRFAKRDCLEDPKNRVVWQVIAPPITRHKTLDCRSEDSPMTAVRVKKTEYVFRINRPMVVEATAQELFTRK